MPNKKKLIFPASLLDEYVLKPFTTKVLLSVVGIQEFPYTRKVNLCKSHGPLLKSSIV